VREILFASALRQALRHLNAHQHVDVAKLKVKAARSLTDPLPFDSEALEAARQRLASCEQSSTAQPSRARRWLAGLINGTALLAAMAFAVAIHQISERTISTGAGEWRSTRLDDGSLLRLGPRTTVSIDLNDRRRLVRLRHGELMVYVAPDSARPFYVDTEIATARAVGTAFAVGCTEPGRAKITVQEGIVAIARGRVPERSDERHAAVMLTAGEGVSIANDRRALAPHTINLDKDLAWVQEKLIFDETSTIAEAIQEFNLRNRTQIRLLDAQAGERAIRGAFSASDPTMFTQVLARALPLSVIERDDTLLLIPRRGGAEKEETAGR
jgi:transmembrane sensor